MRFPANNRIFKSVKDVVSWRLCAGCGVCGYVCPQNSIQLVDVSDQGLRPVIDLAKCQDCGECVKVCPGIEVSHELFSKETLVELRQAWGPVLEVWEGYASDPEIRFKGSSGGVVTALALFCLEKGLASAVLQVGPKSNAPLENASFLSKSREELMACIGSRYSPAAPCEGLNQFEESDSPCVFIGKPCDIVALRKLQALNSELKGNTALEISIFCAGTPSMSGTSKILKSLGVKPEDVSELRYRGCGWPGETVVKIKGCDDQNQMSYEQSWSNILTKYVPLRCRLCPDGTGELADISCGDPWHREIEPGAIGQSLVLVRTKRGRDILHRAIKAGYVQLDQVEPSTLPRSQKALLTRRCHLWGRLIAMRILGIPVPKYKGFALFRNWLRLTTIGKVTSVLGTFRRIIIRRLWRFLPNDGRNCMNEMEKGFEGRRKLGTNNG